MVSSASHLLRAIYTQQQGLNSVYVALRYFSCPRINHVCSSQSWWLCTLLRWPSQGAQGVRDVQPGCRSTYHTWELASLIKLWRSGNILLYYYISYRTGCLYGNSWRTVSQKTGWTHCVPILRYAGGGSASPASCKNWPSSCAHVLDSCHDTLTSAMV